MDSFTIKGARANYAQVRVHVNLTKPLLGAIWIGEWKQQIQYEGIQALCFSCGMIGHPNHGKSETTHMKRKLSPPNHSTQSSNQDEEGKDNSPGPWTLVTRQWGKALAKTPTGDNWNASFNGENSMCETNIVGRQVLTKGKRSTDQTVMANCGDGLRKAARRWTN